MFYCFEQTSTYAMLSCIFYTINKRQGNQTVSAKKELSLKRWRFPMSNSLVLKRETLFNSKIVSSIKCHKMSKRNVLIGTMSPYD